MALDRDLAVAFVRAWSGVAGDRNSGWEMTAATGVRGLRLLREGRAFVAFTLTERHPEAYWVLAENASVHTGARAVLGDGRVVPDGAPFDYVDLDPYGTPVPFLPTALEAVRPGGVLATTATDMMVLAGVQRGASERRYGARPIRGRLAPEGGLRILLAYVARTARARGRAIRPLLAYARDHYVRAYVEVRALDATTAPDPIGPIEPETWEGPPVGDRGPYGPLWLGPLFDAGIVRALAVPPDAAQPHELTRFLERLGEEIEVDRPFYYESNRLASELHLASPPSVLEIRDALRAGGYRAARTQARPEGIRTDAPAAAVAEIVRGLAPQSQNARVRA